MPSREGSSPDGGDPAKAGLREPDHAAVVRGVEPGVVSAARAPKKLERIGAEPPDQAIGIGPATLRYELRVIRPFRARHGRFIVPASEH